LNAGGNLSALPSLLIHVSAAKIPRKRLIWIEKRRAVGHKALKDVPSKQQMTIALEDLAISKPEETYRKLSNFLEISGSLAMRKFFE